MGATDGRQQEDPEHAAGSTFPRGARRPPHLAGELRRIDGGVAAFWLGTRLHEEATRAFSSSHRARSPTSRAVAAAAQFTRLSRAPKYRSRGAQGRTPSPGRMAVRLTVTVLLHFSLRCLGFLSTYSSSFWCFPRMEGTQPMAWRVVTNTIRRAMQQISFVARRYR